MSRNALFSPQNAPKRALGDRAPPGLAGELTALPQAP